MDVISVIYNTIVVIIIRYLISQILSLIGINDYINMTMNKWFNGQSYVTVASIEGRAFNITKVNRLQMGAYLCIASNGVPPTVSKRIMLVVHCK